MLMTAEEARRKMIEERNKEEEEQLKEIETLINKNLKYGYIYYGKNIQVGAYNTLITLGYKIESFRSQKDGCSTKISWK